MEENSFLCPHDIIAIKENFISCYEQISREDNKPANTTSEK